ncbi:MAG: hypothetical protein PWQ17_2076 [Anaerophaga sp.]|nr:hypothetical protein [Anaerophaga sp.]MDK2842570.1 hypothetical protein [Anaerophaga sp.]
MTQSVYFEKFTTQIRQMMSISASNIVGFATCRTKHSRNEF